MAKRMLHQITEEERAKLRSLTTEAAITAYVDTLNLGMADATQLASKYKGELLSAARPGVSTNLAEEATLALGFGGVVSAAAVTRVAELLKGKQMRYEAFLNLEELIGRLRTLLGDKYRIARLDPLSVALTSLGDGTRLCEVRFAPEDGASATSVTISRPNVDKAKDTVADVADEAFRRMTRPMGSGGIADLLDLGKKVVSTAVETAGQMGDVSTVIEAIEAYGAEAEEAAVKARREAKDKKEAEARATDLKERQVIVCRYCGAEAPEDAAKCPNCSGSPR